MKTTLKILIYSFIFLLLMGGIVLPANAASTQGKVVPVVSSSPLKLEILSAKTISGTAGDYVTVKAQITNMSTQQLNGLTTYLSLVDTQNKLPVDLEDWSAEKGLFIGSIDSGQTLPLNWKIHFVKAGNYSLTVVADIAGKDVPQISSLTYFDVAAKRNLNPGQVLPVALGTPIFIVFLLMLINYNRKRSSMA